MSAESRVGFFRSGFTVAVLKGAGLRPEVRDELIKVVRNGIGSREQVVARLDVTSVRTSSEERGLKQVRPSEERVGEGAFWMGIGVNEGLMALTFLVK